MFDRRFGLFAAALLLSGCPGASPDPQPPAPPSLREPGVTFTISGELTGPKPFLSTTEIVGQLQSMKQEALGNQTIFLADAKLQPLKDASTTKSDASGRFTIQSPERAGFLLTRVGSASAPLAAFYREGTRARISLGSTMVAWKISADMASRSVAITTIDPAKVERANQVVDAELAKGTSLRPDYSLSSWVQAMDWYARKYQGDFAKAFNDIIPQSVGPKPR
ncbi:MAG TPA: hypothetical protein V6D00_13620 [Pantanalinema sp.]